jgi:cysteine desulfurase
MTQIYLDYNATTPIRSEVKEAMSAGLDVYGNASSMHETGRVASERVERARASVAKLIGATVEEILFTSGGSESNNTVFQTMLWRGEGKERRAVVTTAIEHPCVINSAEFLASRGVKVTFLPVDPDGKIHLDEVRAAVDSGTLLVSVMLANNEIGTIQDVAAVARIARAAGAYVHTDAVQAVGKIPVDVRELDVDYLTMSAHKIYGPKGVGALYVRRGAPLEPLIRGGHQERGLRAGTYNNLGILGFGAAADLALAELGRYGAETRRLRAKLRDGLLERVPNIKVNGSPREVLPNTLNVSFPGAEGEAILLSLDILGIRASTGSACASGSLDPSPVLMAVGLGPELAHGSIRFSLGRTTTDADIDYVLENLPPVIARLRAMSTVA